MFNLLRFAKRPLTPCQGRRYLDYDLEALHQYVKTYHCPQVFVAFQDSEGFDSGLLSDIIELFRYGYSWKYLAHCTDIYRRSWSDRITFALIFGIATSIDLFQARLLKSACRYLYGEQFDVALSSTILSRILKVAVAATEVAVRIGPVLLSMLLERQRGQVAGIEAFISSLKVGHLIRSIWALLIDQSMPTCVISLPIP